MRKILAVSMFVMCCLSTTFAYGLDSGGGQGIIVPPVQTMPETYEPNDSTTSAYTISNGVKYTSYLSKSTDVDYYKFVPATTESVLVGLYTVTGNNYDVYVYDQELNLIAKGDQPANATEDVLLKVTAGKVYYLKVFSPSGDFDTFSYNLKVNSLKPAVYTYDLSNRITSIMQERALFSIKYSFNFDKYGNLLKVIKEKIVL